jgi:hypothetical protein
MLAGTGCLWANSPHGFSGAMKTLSHTVAPAKELSEMWDVTHGATRGRRASVGIAFTDDDLVGPDSWR